MLASAVFAGPAVRQREMTSMQQAVRVGVGWRGTETDHHVGDEKIYEGKQRVSYRSHLASLCQK